MSSVALAAVGKWRGILISLGVDQSYLVDRHGACPICGGKDRFRFDDKNGKGSYFCSGCGAGDGFSLLRKINGWNFAEAAKRVESVIGKCLAAPVVSSDTSNNERRLKNIHSSLKRISHGDIAGKYLLSRGVSILPEQDVYFHPGIAYFDKNTAGKSIKVGVFPAMVSIFRNISGETCSFHVTYLNPDGSKLADYEPKKILPKIRDMTGGAIRLGGICERIGIAEGIETAMSAMQFYGHPVWAAANANFLQNVQIPEPVKSVVIYTDEDKSFTGQKAAYTLANRLKVQEGREVEVIRIIGQGASLYSDKGCDMDFNDYTNRQGHKQ
jgi:putative DNA primase/helicase